jgi:hypothetical protein
MHTLPPPIVFNEDTGRFEIHHLGVMRRMHHANRLRSRYRSRLTRRAFRFLLALPRHGMAAAFAAASGAVLRVRARRASQATAQT